MATSPISRQAPSTPPEPGTPPPAQEASGATQQVAQSSLLSVAAARRQQASPRTDSMDEGSSGRASTGSSPAPRRTLDTGRPSGVSAASYATAMEYNRASAESHSGPSLHRAYEGDAPSSGRSSSQAARPAVEDVEQHAPGAAADAVAARLTKSHGHYVVETRYRPVNLQEQEAFFAERDRQVAIDIPLDRGNRILSALGLAQKAPRRDMTRAHDLHLRSLNFDPAAAVKTYAAAGSSNAVVGVVSDATAMLVTALSARYGNTTGKAVAFFLGQLGATIAAQGLLAYVRLYTLMLSELSSREGYTARSKTVKNALPPEEAMAGLQLAIKEAKHLGAHAIRTDIEPGETTPEQIGIDLGRLREPPVESDIRALEDSKANLEAAILAHYIPQQDDDSYFRAKTRQSNVQLARSAVAAFASNIVRQARPADCNLGNWALLTTGLILLAARTVQILWAARRDEADKRTHAHKLTLEVTPLNRPEAGKLAEGYAQTYLSQSAIRMTHVDSILSKKESEILESMAGLLGVQEQHMLAYERAGGLQEILRVATPLTGREREELATFRGQSTDDTADIPRADILRWIALEHAAHAGLDDADKAQLAALSKKLKTHNLSGAEWQRFASSEQVRAGLDRALDSHEGMSDHDLQRLQVFREMGDDGLAQISLDMAVEYASLEIRSELNGGAGGEQHRGNVVARLAKVQVDAPLKALYDQARDDRLGQPVDDDQPRVQLGSRTMPATRYATLNDEDLTDHLLADRANDSLKPREQAKLLALQARRGGYEQPEPGTDRTLATKADTRLRELANSNLSRHGPEVARKMAALRSAANELVSLRVDQAMLKTDWNKLSDPSRDLVRQYYVDGRSTASLALQTFKARASQFGGMLPGLWSGVGGALHLAILGSQAPVAVNSFFKIFGEQFPQLTECLADGGLTSTALEYSKIRFAAQAALLLPQVATSRQGVPGVLNKDIRRSRDPRLVKDGENLPTVAETALRFAPSALATMYYKQLSSRWVKAPGLEQEAGRMLDKIDDTLARLRAHSPAVAAAPAARAALPAVPEIVTTEPQVVVTPPVDKGKQRAEPEPMEAEPQAGPSRS